MPQDSTLTLPTKTDGLDFTWWQRCVYVRESTMSVEAPRSVKQGPERPRLEARCLFPTSRTRAAHTCGSLTSHRGEAKERRWSHPFKGYRLSSGFSGQPHPSHPFLDQAFCLEILELVVNELNPLVGSVWGYRRLACNECWASASPSCEILGGQWEPRAGARPSHLGNLGN